MRGYRYSFSDRHRPQSSKLISFIIYVVVRTIIIFKLDVKIIILRDSSFASVSSERQAISSQSNRMHPCVNRICIISTAIVVIQTRNNRTTACRVEIVSVLQIYRGIITIPI